MIVFLLASLVAGVAHAERRRLVLVSADAELYRQVGIALSAWEIEVATSNEAPPGTAFPEAGRRAEALARALHADAIAWVAASDGDAVLFLYDATTSQVASRVLGVKPPFDDANAAAVALSLKTLLRSSAIAPEKERFGAAPASTAPPAPPVWRIDALAGYRAAPSAVPEFRAGLGTSFWPHFLGDSVGLGAGASFGPGARPNARSFSGTFSDIALSADLRARFALGRRLVLEPALGPSLHFTSLEGTTLPGAETVRASRADVSLDGALTLDYRLGIVSVGLRVAAGYLVRYQRYFVGNDEALSIAPVLGEAGLRLGVGIF